MNNELQKQASLPEITPSPAGCWFAIVAGGFVIFVGVLGVLLVLRMFTVAQFAHYAFLAGALFFTVVGYKKVSDSAAMLRHLRKTNNTKSKRIVLVTCILACVLALVLTVLFTIN